MERKKVCSVMDCQKLSREACTHAAQNDRLPVHTVVQVLYYEQQRLREAVDSGDHIASSSPPAKIGTCSVDVHPVTDEVSSLRMENHDLKMELLNMKMRLIELDKRSTKVPVAVNHSSTPSPVGMGKPPLPKKSFISSVSKKLGKLLLSDWPSPGPKGRTRPSKDRRHSIS